MPAAIATAAALIVHSTKTVDADIGIKYGLPGTGLLVQSIGVKASREKEVHLGHRKERVAVIYATPNIVFSVDAKVLQLSGRLAAKHPGDAIHPGFVQDAYPEIGHGFTFSSPGYFLYDEPDTGSPQGSFHTCKFNLEWFAAADTTVHVADGAVAPA